VSALLVADGDASELASALQRVVVDARTHHALTAAARSVAAESVGGAVGERWLALLAEVER
jgi:hypothetical protein